MNCPHKISQSHFVGLIEKFVPKQKCKPVFGDYFNSLYLANNLLRLMREKLSTLLGLLGLKPFATQTIIISFAIFSSHKRFDIRYFLLRCLPPQWSSLLPI